ncbi:MAG: ABC transporter permease [Romboutsia sp.]|uniref:ABC transporter permease n=1 Tax=Romboutsia sp. TaxID=1965302 RepID=UPI003F2EE3C6
MISLLIAKKEFMRNLKSKKKLIFMSVVPLLTIIVAIGINTLMKPSINLGVIGESEIAKDFVNRVSNIDGVKINQGNRNSINTDMILAKYVAIIDFQNEDNIKVYSLDKSIKETIEKSIDNAMIIESLVSTLEENTLNTEERSSGFIFMAMMISSILVSCTMLKDREDGVLTRYILSGNGVSNYIMGNFIYNLVSSSIQVILSIILIYILKFNIGDFTGEFLIVLLLIVLISASLSTLIAVTSNSELQGSLIASTLALIISLFGGAFLPLDKMPDLLKIVSNLSVSKWIIELVGNFNNGIFVGKNLVVIIGIIVFSIGTLGISVVFGKKKFALIIK